MSEWKETTLGELIDIKHGWAFKGEFLSESLSPHNIVVGIGNFNYSGGFRFESTRLKEYTSDYPKEYELVPSDILLAMTCQTAGGKILGIPGRIPNDKNLYLHNQRLGKIEIKKSELLDKSFVYWLCLWSLFNHHLFVTASGTKILHTAPERIKSFQFKCPPINLQKEIGKTLDSLDAKIENLRQQKETLEKIAQTLFKHWFIDFEFPNADGKPYKSSGGVMVPSELGDIPEGWGTFRLIETIEQLKPGTNYQPERVSQGIPFINVKNIQNGFLSLQNVKYITEEEYKRVHKSWIPEENDILISRIGTLGNVGVIRKQDLPVAVHYNNLNIKSKKISFQLLYFILKSDFFQTQYHSKKMQSVQEYLTVEEAGNLKIILPELPQALGDFERIFKNTFDKVRNNENQIQTLTKTRDSLLPKLMSGQIRVKE